MKNGKIWLWRKSQDSWLYHEKPFSPFHAWIDILLSANFAKRSIPVGGKMVELNPGQICRSMEAWAHDWGWTESKVRRFFAKLETDNMIRRKIDGKMTVVTVCNWSIYQDERRKIDGKSTENRRQNKNVIDHRGGVEEGKTDRSSLEITQRKRSVARSQANTPKFEKFWKAQLVKRGGKEYAFTCWKKAIRKKSAEELIAAWQSQIEYYRLRQKVTGTRPMNPSTWLNRGCWDDEVDCSEFKNANPQKKKFRSAAELLEESKVKR